MPRRRKRRAKTPEGAAGSHYFAGGSGLPDGPAPGGHVAPGEVAPPLIMTLQLDEITTGLFQRQRDLFYPRTLNRVPAHLTLFHHLPGAEFDAVMRVAAAVVARPPFPVAFEGLRAMGRGVAYNARSDALEAVRAALATPYAPWLRGQDRERFRPHVTVQNKVTAGEAKRTLALLARDFAPFTATAEGLQLWHYLGGPWAPAASIPFQGVEGTRRLSGG